MSAVIEERISGSKMCISYKHDPVCISSVLRLAFVCFSLITLRPAASTSIDTLIVLVGLSETQIGLSFSIHLKFFCRMFAYDFFKKMATQ